MLETKQSINVIVQKILTRAEMNLAEDAEAYRAGKHNGWEDTAWEGIKMSLEVLAKKKTKVVINGGCLNPKGLAEKVFELVAERGYSLKVAYVSGDDLLPELGPDLVQLGEKLPPHLDSVNTDITVPFQSLAWKNLPSVPIVSANAYLGARAIVGGLRAGADIIICGRVSDASPVIGAAWYWHDWKDTDYTSLAGSLIAGHLIECSAYVTGGNYSNFAEHDLESLIDPGFPIAEIAADGTCVITKHEGTGGMVTVETVRCQLLYELQGNVYLHSDCKAYLDDVAVEEVGKDRWVQSMAEIRDELLLMFTQRRRFGSSWWPATPNDKGSNFLSRRLPESALAQCIRLQYKREVEAAGDASEKRSTGCRNRKRFRGTRVSDVSWPCICLLPMVRETT